MPKLWHHRVECDECKNLVEPETPAKRRKYGVILALVLGAIGGGIGATIGIATAGWGAPATIPLTALGLYTGWKGGTGWRRFRDGVTCPKCGYVFGGRGHITLPGGDISLHSLSSDSGDDHGEEPAFHVDFTCGNCGSNWSFGFEAGEQVTESTEHIAGVIVDDGDTQRALHCPTCDAAESVSISDRKPATSTTERESRSLVSRFVETVLYLYGSILAGVLVGVALVAAGNEAIVSPGILFAAVATFVYLSVIDKQFID